MMFLEQYEKILSIIINSDSKNKERILEFIKEIPSELLEQLSIDLQVIRCGNNEDITNIGNQYETGDKVLYWYLINSNIYESIDIGFSVYDGNKYMKAFELTLIYNNDIRLNSNDKIWLGKIEYNINEYQVDNKTYIESIEQEYQLVKHKLGMFVLNYKNGSLSSINKVNLLKGNKLVRKKR